MNEFISSRKKSFQCAFAGIGYILRTQKNSWIHLFFTVVVILVSIWLKLSALEIAVLTICIAMVWVTECVNTSIETIFDLIHPKEHPLVRIAKDVAAGAVLISALASVVVGLLILGPPLLVKAGQLF